MSTEAGDVAWVIGLGIAFSFPASTASTADWATFERDHQGSVILQEYLIHGVAAVACGCLGFWSRR